MKNLIIMLLFVTSLMATTENNPQFSDCSDWHTTGCGEQGVQGEQGIKGDSGVDGVDGLDGINVYEVIHTYDVIYQELDLTLFYAEMAKQTTLMITLMEQGLDMQAGSMAVSSIDFNPDHDGHSIGWGFGTGSTYNSYRAVAGALGYQYAQDGVSFVIKTWVGKDHAYGVGIGGVIGF